jgi:hypothetical protein
MSHKPLSIKKVDRPIFHFSIVTGPEYIGGAINNGRLFTDIPAAGSPAAQICWTSYESTSIISI